VDAEVSSAIFHFYQYSMTKEVLVKILTDVLSHEGFKRKGNNWVENKGEISKIVNLQKSQFGNLFYINYGYAMKNLPLNGAKMHIHLRVSTVELGKKDNVSELLILDNQIPDRDRCDMLTKILTVKLIPELRSVNTESDIRRRIVDGPWQNIVPVKVKHYFGLR